MTDLLHELHLPTEADHLDVVRPALGGGPDLRRTGDRRELDPQQAVVPLDVPDLADRREPGQDLALVGHGVAGLGEADPARVAVGGFASEERHAGRIGAAPGKARQHVEHDPTDRLGVLPLGQVAGDATHGPTPPRVERARCPSGQEPVSSFTLREEDRPRSTVMQLLPRYGT